MSEKTHTRVREVMTPAPHVVDGLSNVGDAIALMRARQVSSLVVDRRHDGDEYGIVVVHDIAQKVIGMDKSPYRTTIYEVMSKPVLTVDCEMDIKYAIRLLARFGLSRSLVTEGGELVGIVTMRDMVFRYIPQDRAVAEQLPEVY